MERAAEWYVMVTGIIIGLSHILHPGAWADAFAALHRLESLALDVYPSSLYGGHESDCPAVHPFQRKSS